jgi:membrane fusion protein, multidrug efflux system
MTDSSNSNPGARRKGLALIGGVVVVAGVAWAGWHWFAGRYQEYTDNAYVSGNVAQITPQVGGTVVYIRADETDYVKAGEPLIKLDPTDYKVALDQAEARLAQTVRETRGLFANHATLTAQVQAREAELTRAKSDLGRAQDDVDRRNKLVATGAVGKEEFEHANVQLATARSAVEAAQSAVQAAREQLSASEAMIDGTTVIAHPAVKAAAAQVRTAYIALQRSVLIAPTDGYVAKRNVQLGQQVQGGSPLMSMVALNQLWVDANFKENQLGVLRIGQPVELESDLYGSKVVYHGKVIGLGAGTGAAFSLLPAQNATGNWIKVVQRVPVRIALDPKEVAEHPLRVGLSMEVTVDTQSRDGKLLADAPRSQVSSQTDLYDAQSRDADALVQRLIQSNLGGRAPAAKPTADRPLALAHVAGTANVH